MLQNMDHFQKNKNTWNNPRFLPNNAYPQYEKKRQNSHDKADTASLHMSIYLKKQNPQCVTNAIEFYQPIIFYLNAASTTLKKYKITSPAALTKHIGNVLNYLKEINISHKI